MTFIVKILGSNSAVPAFNRNHTSQLVQIDNNFILIDCGEGTQLQLIKYKIKFGKIDYILISHLHGDHYLGLMGLIFTFNLYGRIKQLNIFGPKGLEEIITTQLKYSDTRLNFEIRFHETNPNQADIVLYHNKFTITSFPLKHRIACTGFLLRENLKKRKLVADSTPDNITKEQIALVKQGKDIVDDKGAIIINHKNVTLPPNKSRSYAYCSDCKYDEELIPIISSVDLLYHESTFLNDLSDRAEMTHHSTAEQAAKIALSSNVDKLIIGHFSSRYRELDPFLSEAKAVFINTELAKEGESFEIIC